jgi:hypothetical protein
LSKLSDYFKSDFLCIVIPTAFGHGDEVTQVFAPLGVAQKQTDYGQIGSLIDISMTKPNNVRAQCSEFFTNTRILNNSGLCD